MQEVILVTKIRFFLVVDATSECWSLSYETALIQFQSKSIVLLGCFGVYHSISFYFRVSVGCLLWRTVGLNTIT